MIERRPVLTREEKEEIRRLHCKGVMLRAEASKYSIESIARDYGRCKNTIWGIVAGDDEYECSGLEQSLLDPVRHIAPRR